MTDARRQLRKLFQEARQEGKVEAWINAVRAVGRVAGEYYLDAHAQVILNRVQEELEKERPNK